MSNIKRIVLTGGPGGGKTTTLEYLRQHNENLYIEPEAATMVLKSGFPVPDGSRPWSQEWQNSFQAAVRGMQEALDNLACQEASLGGAQAIVQDRSHVDAAVYYASEQDYEQRTMTTIAKEIGRASLVFFLPTFAGTTNFDARANPHRFEEESTMVELSNKLEKIWTNHPRFFKLEAATVEDRAQIISELIKIFT